MREPEVAKLRRAASAAGRMQAREDYRPAHLISLFDEMARTYGAVNLISSFGFSHGWRRACIDALEVAPGHRCADLMSGMCEGSVLLAARGAASVRAVDFAPAMVTRANETLRRRGLGLVRTAACDVFTLEDVGAFDRICVSFGIKTLDDAGLERFARLLHRLLSPGGRVALVEIGVPPAALLRGPYLFYLRHVIPLIGRLCLGDPDCYRSLAIYTESFARRDRFRENLAAAGLVASGRPLFFGCARLYVATKPAS